MTGRDAFPVGGSTTLQQLEADPHPQLQQLQATEPVSWVPAIGGWLVTGRDLGIAVMRDASTYTVDDPRFSTGQVIGPSMLSLDGAEHLRHREPFVDQYRAGAVRSRLSAWTTARATELVADMQKAGHAELRSELAAPLAAAVMTEALALDGVGTPELLGWYDEIVAGVDAITAGHGVPDEALEAFGELKAAVLVTMEANPGSPIAAVASTGRLTVDEIVSNVAVLLFGGIVTSEGTMGTLFHQMLQHPDQLEMVRKRPELAAAAVDEALRFEPAAAVVDRYATGDTQLGSADIRSGELVRVSLSAASRDPSVFEQPEEFDILRSNAPQHLAFARGPHACLGLHLARLEARIALEVLIEELSDIQLDPEATEGPVGLIFRGPRAVGARW
ncbi:MAG: cytochrome P450 [Acidimicrobiia bacterium]